jgi:predicted 2-oxoglutarate/Fe(II)-dependent dioxygenase YbiX
MNMYANLLDLTQPLSFTLDGVLSPDECRSLIARIEAAGPKVAPVSRAEGPVVDLEMRNNTRVMFDDPELAALLYARVVDRVPATISGRRVVGANERLRCYRYAAGQRFAPHYDGAFARDLLECSKLTFIVYLNEEFTGGETAMLDLDQVIVPRTGRALLFQHAILHEGCEVTSGVKYAVRSDIMYRLPPSEAR